MAVKTDQTSTEAGGFDLGREGGEGWRPEKGDKLVGTIADVGARWSDWQNGGRGGFYPVQTIVTEDGSTQGGKPIKVGTQIAVHGFHTVLFRRIMALKPLPGERVGIMFHGEFPNSDGKTRSAVYTYKVAREAGAGPDPYGGLKPPGGKDVKEEVRTANSANVSDAELNQLLS
jgi:hypothetical protein